MFSRIRVKIFVINLMVLIILTVGTAGECWLQNFEYVSPTSSMTCIGPKNWRGSAIPRDKFGRVLIPNDYGNYDPGAQAVWFKYSEHEEKNHTFNPNFILILRPLSKSPNWGMSALDILKSYTRKINDKSFLVSPQWDKTAKQLDWPDYKSWSFCSFRYKKNRQPVIEIIYAKTVKDKLVMVEVTTTEEEYKKDFASATNAVNKIDFGNKR